MSYSDALRVSHSMGSQSTTATITKALKGPAGKRGRVVGVQVGVSASITGTLLLQVGVSGTLAKFASVTVGALASPNGVFSEAMNVATQPAIEATDTVLITLSGATAGTVEPTVIIDWY